jgi:hypothetical protein
MKYGLMTIVLVLIAGIAYAAKDYVLPTTWRYKITVEVETPEGLKTGSAVREVRAWKNVAKFLNPDVRPVTYEVIGEAVVVDLEKRGVLFILMNVNAEQETKNSFSTEIRGDWERVTYFSNIKFGEKTKLENNGPRMVTFEDLSIPASVKRVSDAEMTTVFGDGVILKNIAIEMTGDPIMWSIEKWLPWLPEYYDQRLDGNQFGNIKAINRTANSLSAGAFSAGRKR